MLSKRIINQLCVPSGVFSSNYTKKLGWEMITKTDSSWVRVVSANYSYGNLAIAIIQSNPKASHIWRGICKNWEQYYLLTRVQYL